MYKLQEVSRGNYDDRGYSNEQSIAALMIQKPEEINAALIYSYGMDDDRFPLTFLTEGQGSIGVRDIGTQEWTWKTMGRMKFNDYVTYFNTADTTPGLGGKMIEVHFKNHLIIEQYGLNAPDGRTQFRVMKDCGPSEYGYKYLLKMTFPNAKSSYADPTLFAKGKYFSLTAPTISESYSKGNRSNVMGPGKMKGQLGYHRFTKEIAGNVSNVVVEYAFKNKDGNGTTNLWINEEMRQFNVQKMIMMEEWLWMSHYNRDANGEIVLDDADNNNPIPTTAGMFEIAEESNYDTYGDKLTLAKLDRTIFDGWTKDTDTGSMDVVLFGGKGGIQDFDNAIREDAKDNGFLTPLGDKMISDISGGLAYGKYFRQYNTVDGHRVTVKHLPFLDYGTLAENDKSNGRLHPTTGLPMSSHQLISIDNSVYQGERNIRVVRQKGQTYIPGILKGLTPIPASWGVLKDNAIGTEIDKSVYEEKISKGLQVNKSDKMFVLRSVL